MKKLSIIFSLLFAIAFSVQQAHAQVRFGIRSGANFANLYGFSSNLAAQGRTGFLVGAYLQIPVGNNFIFQPALLYTAKGFKENMVELSKVIVQNTPSVFRERGTKLTHLNYISIPLLLKYEFSPRKILSPYVAAGPYAAFLIRDKVIYKQVPGSESTVNMKNSKKIINKTGDIGNAKQFDIGASIGAGLRFHDFNLGVRYSLGFVPIDESESISEKNSAFSIVAGFTF